MENIKQAAFKSKCEDRCTRETKELVAYIDGCAYKCPKCDAVVLLDETEYSTLACIYSDIEEIEKKCEDCNNLCTFERIGVSDYFEHPIDIEYRVGEEKEYRGVRVMMDDGPAIYIDTQAEEVQLSWDGVNVTRKISLYAVDAINDYFQWRYDCIQ